MRFRAPLAFPPDRSPSGVVVKPDGGCVVVHGPHPNGPGTLERRDANGAVVDSFDVPAASTVHHAYGDTYLLAWKNGASSSIQLETYGTLGEAFPTAGPVFRVSNELWFSARSTQWTLYRAKPGGNEMHAGFLATPQPIVGGSAWRLVTDRGTIHDPNGNVVIVGPESAFTDYAGPCESGVAIFSSRTGKGRESRTTFYRIDEEDRLAPIAHASQDESSMCSIAFAAPATCSCDVSTTTRACRSSR